MQARLENQYREAQCLFILSGAQEAAGNWNVKNCSGMCGPGGGSPRANWTVSSHTLSLSLLEWQSGWQIFARRDVGNMGQVAHLAAGCIVDADARAIQRDTGSAIELDARFFIRRHG